MHLGELLRFSSRTRIPVDKLRFQDVHKPIGELGAGRDATLREHIGPERKTELQVNRIITVCAVFSTRLLRECVSLTTYVHL